MRFAITAEVAGILTIVNIVRANVARDGWLPADGLAIGMELVDDVWTRPAPPPPMPPVYPPALQPSDHALFTQLRDRPETITLDHCVSLLRAAWGLPWPI